MRKNQRFAISAIAITLATGKRVSSVYSFADGNYANVSCDVNAQNISVYDHERGCHISGSESSKNKYSLYDYGLSNHIDLEMKNRGFSGYDYDSGSHFEGTMSGGSVSFYDFETGEFYEYSG